MNIDRAIKRGLQNGNICIFSTCSSQPPSSLAVPLNFHHSKQGEERLQQSLEFPGVPFNFHHSKQGEERLQQSLEFPGVPFSFHHSKQGEERLQQSQEQRYPASIRQLNRYPLFPNLHHGATMQSVPL